MAILAIDQGTTGTTVLLVEHDGAIVSKAYREFRQFYPFPGWVEHDPEEIWQTVMDCVSEIMTRLDGTIEAVGITNQRETTVVWDAKTGKPVYNAIVWQCRRTSAICNSLEPYRELIKQKTGLPLDAYFSGTKVKWILENAPVSEDQDLRFGTIDSWLIWKLTGGRVHATDYTNASRTMLYNIHSREWDAELCELLEIPESILPEVRPSSGDFGIVESIPELINIPISGVAGDQQASLFGQQCFTAGEIKNTYGTGCFIMMNTGSQAIDSQHGLITTLAVAQNGEPCYALEGSVFIAGAAVQWLRDELGLIQTAAESEAAANSISDNGGVYLVPAFVGLGAPYWDMEARGIIAGLTRGSSKNHLIRAGLESMCYQTYDVIKAMEQDTELPINGIAVDGGATENDFLMQFQADILNLVVERADRVETTALGAAYLAGLAQGIWTPQILTEFSKQKVHFHPSMLESERQKNIAGWHLAIRKAQCS
ncbi:MAG: glycerol kinase GlpK [Candidatus Marinimicrobia bacterium]|nr:glycerol kinase GlpK [Candidatus Neomarinimicrobiota bacterium]